MTLFNDWDDDGGGYDGWNNGFGTGFGQARGSAFEAGDESGGGGRTGQGSGMGAGQGFRLGGVGSTINLGMGAQSGSGMGMGTDDDGPQNIHPYFQVKQGGPLKGWNDHALDNLKQSIGLKDYGLFLQDRIGTYAANRMSSGDPPLEHKLDYEPTEYGVPKNSAMNDTQNNPSRDILEKQLAKKTNPYQGPPTGQYKDLLDYWIRYDGLEDKSDIIYKQNWQESNYDKNATGNPMQLTQKTAESLGVNRNNLNESIKGGISYLKQMYGKYGSDELALGAYNGGVGNVDSCGGIPDNQRTPYYVSKILGRIPDESIRWGCIKK